MPADASEHTPVLYEETLEALKPLPGGVYVDGTLGSAGHAEGILRLSSPTGRLYGVDQDAQAVGRARARLSPFEGRFELRQMNFADLADWMAADSCDGVVLDLGVSSPQLDNAERGFSFQQDGPLDMRMNQSQSLTAAELVNEAPVENLARVLWEYGDERQARRFARAIGEERLRRKLATTGELAALIERLSPRAGRRTHPATRVFQALRIAVNDELAALERGLPAALGILKPGGILAVITFHSVEDRIVKNFGRARARCYTFEGPVDVPELRRPCAPELELVNRKPIKPGTGELASNPRSRSAQLRVMRKSKT